MKMVIRGVSALVILLFLRNAWGQTDKTPAPPLRLAVELADGSRVIGVPSVASIPLRTSYAQMDVPLDRIVSIQVSTNHETAAFRLSNGDALKGVVALKSLDLDTVFGRVAIGAEHIRSIATVKGTVPTFGLVLHYSFDRENQMAQDLDGRGKDGTVHGAVWTPDGKAAGACEFDGVDDYIDANDCGLLNQAKEMSVSVWFKYNADSNPSTGDGIVSRFYSGDGNPPGSWGLILDGDPPNARLTFVTMGIDGPSVDTKGIQKGEWYHAVGTYDGETRRLYLNGKLVSEVPGKGGIAATQFPTYIGAGVDQQGTPRPGSYFKGVIDEVMVWTRELPASEVEAVYRLQQ